MLRSPSLSRLLSASRSPTQCQVFPSRQLPSAASPASPSVQAAGWATEGRAGPVHKAGRYRPVQAGATQIGGTATSGSVGTTAGSASALGTTAATSAAAASGAPALVVWRRSWQHPFSQSSRSLARRRRWPPRWRSRNHGNVEPRSATPPTAVQTASSGNASNGVAGTGVELAASDGGFAAGATRGLDDGTKNADAGDKKKPKAKKKKKKKKKNKGTGNAAPVHAPAAPAAALSPAPTEPASNGDYAGVQPTIAKVSESGGQGKPPKTGNATPGTGRTRAGWRHENCGDLDRPSTVHLNRHSTATTTQRLSTTSPCSVIAATGPRTRRAFGRARQEGAAIDRSNRRSDRSGPGGRRTQRPAALGRCSGRRVGPWAGCRPRSPARPPSSGRRSPSARGR